MIKVSTYNLFCSFQIIRSFAALAILCLLGLETLAEDYQGAGTLDARSGSPRLESFTFTNFKSGEWFARSIGDLQRDVSIIQFLLRQQPPEKRIYLPDPEDERALFTWGERFKLKQPCYQPFLIFKDRDESVPIALGELHTMPRAVAVPQEQEPILSFYQGKGLMTYNPSNTNEKWVGKYRAVRDGNASMARLRLLMTQEFKENMPIITDIINGTSALIRTFRDNGFPVHPYPTDPIQGLPSIIMSYTALEESVRQAYKNAGFNLEYNVAFKEYWPPEYRDSLPPDMVVATQFINSSPSMAFNFNVV